ncbi:MAG: GtrA-like protein [Firmicutes bacterium]|nr:GtrA-like protein [Bacillota bacterium]
MLISLISFLLVGVIGTVINMIVYIGLTSLRFNYLIAAGCSFVVASSSNFIGHVMWTFKNQEESKNITQKYLLFITISIIALGMNFFCLEVQVRYFKMNETLAQLISIFMVSGLNFILNRSITFSCITIKKGP